MGGDNTIRIEIAETREPYWVAAWKAASCIGCREESYLLRKADGISAGEKRALIDNNNDR